MSAGCLDYVACHGFVTALAIRYDQFDANQLLSLVIDGEPTFQSSDEKDTTETAIQALFIAISRHLYLGDSLPFPHQFKAPKAGETNEMTDWCFGFMEAISATEDDWFSGSFATEAIAELILPISVFSEPYIDPELAHLVKTDKARTALIAEIPENLQQLYLLFRE